MKTCLFRYVTKILGLPEESVRGHAAEWRSWMLYYMFIDAGYQVDAVSWLDKGFRPKRQYDFVFDVIDLTALKDAYKCDTIKVIELTGADNVWRNAQGELQINRLNERRSCKIPYHRRIANPEQVYESIEMADHVLLVGNEWTRSTYPKRYHDKINLINTTFTRLEV